MKKHQQLKEHKRLYEIWERVNHIPGWLRLLEMTGDYSPDEIIELEGIDEEALITISEAEKYYKEVELPRGKIAEQEFIEEITEEYGKDWIKERRLEYLDTARGELDSEIADIWEDFGKQYDKGLPYWWRKMCLELREPCEFEKKRKRIHFEIHLLKHGEDIKKYSLSPELINKAREFPFSELIKVNARNFALCPFHKEKTPSFHIRKNYGYCFGCNWSGDTIKFIMERENLGFVEAVKRLASI